jgi:hypothetical protein
MHVNAAFVSLPPAEAKEQIQGAAELDAEALAKEQIDRAVDIVAEMQLTSDQLKVREAPHEWIWKRFPAELMQKFDMDDYAPNAAQKQSTQL